MIRQAYNKCLLGVFHKTTYPQLERNVINCIISMFLYDLGRIRTCDRSLRRRMLYPAELLDQINTDNSYSIAHD